MPFDWMFYLFTMILIGITAALILPKPVGLQKYKKGSILGSLFNYDRIRKEAEGVGWALSFREFIALLSFTFIAVTLIAIFIGNYFLIALGLLVCFMLPRIILMKIKRKIRQNTLFDLPPNLRIFISKLSTFPNILSALEQSLPEMAGVTKPMFERAADQLRVGLSLEHVLDELTESFNIRQMDNFADKLRTIQKEGFHARALASLRETVDQITEDIGQVKVLEFEARRKRRDTFLIVIMGWAMPAVLSFLNTDNSNVYLDTLYGQIYVVLFAAYTLFAISKADDYLALNLDKV